MRQPLRPFLIVRAGADGRDRWMLGWRNTIHWARSAPRWLSVRAWLG